MAYCLLCGEYCWDINYCGLGWLLHEVRTAPFSCFNHGHWAPGSSLLEARKHACWQQGQHVMPRWCQLWCLCLQLRQQSGKKEAKYNWWVSFNSYTVSWGTLRVCSETTMPRGVFPYFITGYSLKGWEGMKLYYFVWLNNKNLCAG